LKEDSDSFLWQTSANDLIGIERQKVFGYEKYLISFLEKYHEEISKRTGINTVQHFILEFESSEVQEAIKHLHLKQLDEVEISLSFEYLRKYVEEVMKMDRPELAKELNETEFPSLKSLHTLCAALSQPNPSRDAILDFLETHEHHIKSMEMSDPFYPGIRILNAKDDAQNEGTDDSQEYETTCQYVFATTFDATFLVYYLEGRYTKDTIDDLLMTIPTSQIQLFLELNTSQLLRKNFVVSVLIDESFCSDIALAKIVDGIEQHLRMGLDLDGINIKFGSASKVKEIIDGLERLQVKETSFYPPPQSLSFLSILCSSHFCFFFEF